MKEIPDHPAIRAAEAYGYGTEPVQPICPVCGAECDTVYKFGNQIVGCGDCIHEADAWEAEECFPNEKKGMRT